MKKRILRTEKTTRGKATVRELLKSLFRYGKTVTTLAKAKALKRNADTLVTKGVNGSQVIALRALMKSLGDRTAAREVLRYIGYAIKKRTSGFASIEKIGFRRGDATPVASVSLMDFVKPEKKLSTPKEKVVEKKALTAKEVKKIEPKAKK
ncbi:MAG: bL17 family ribosomal protein [Candidatus Roizmanbacteria bacterium]|nr:bL17 family ribosomal protein [Candidatus Roizmanbacteria bacterium]